MTDSSLDLSARADLDWLADLIGDAHQAAPSVQWLIVGALARDLHLSYAHGIRVDRATTDTDLALTIATWTEFAQVRHTLAESVISWPTAAWKHKLLHRSGRAVDVVPFGDIEDRTGSIAWPPSGTVKMSVIGYREAFAGSIALRLPRDQHARIPSIAGLVILKFIAWSERHRIAPGKDAYDLRMLLDHYLDAGHLQRLYEHHADLVDEDFDYSSQRESRRKRCIRTPVPSWRSVTEHTRTTEQHSRRRSGCCGKACAHRAVSSARCREISPAAGRFFLQGLLKIDRAYAVLGDAMRDYLARKRQQAPASNALGASKQPSKNAMISTGRWPNDRVRHDGSSDRPRDKEVQ